jgi:ribonuclease BN (tRNA processing enzyme)
MEDHSFIKFLGTAGTRFVVARQLRASGGIYISAEGQNVILDPGPGCLVKCARSRPSIDIINLNAIILSHLHIDHSNDVNILIDAMTNGGLNKQGLLFAPRECLEGKDAVVLRYLRDFLDRIEILEENKAYRSGDLKFYPVRLQHTAETYGLKFNIKGRIVSFVADTRYFPELIENFKGSDILILNAVRHIPPERIRGMHLSIPDVKEILRGVKPKKAIITHFGMSMLKAKPSRIAEDLTEKLSLEVIAASDGMKIEL